MNPWKRNEGMGEREGIKYTLKAGTADRSILERREVKIQLYVKDTKGKTSTSRRGGQETHS